MDAGGVKVAKPIYENAGATFVTLVDPLNALSEAFGLDVVPNGFLIDEDGILRYKKVGGFEVKSPETIKAVEEFLARPRAAVSQIPLTDDKTREAVLIGRLVDKKDGQARLELGKLRLRLNRPKEALSPLQQAVDLMPKSSDARFNLGSAHLAVGDKATAVKLLKEALSMDRGNFLIRKQIWLIEHPEKFHPTIDWAWQREQLKKERAEEGGGG
jgi:tetratricopeptide (TPR) repeat protein